MSKSFWKKNEKGEYGLTWYEKLSEDEKERLVEYRKRYYKMQKKYKFVIKIKKVLSYPLNQTDTKMSFF